jgi:RNA polymerase sigma factor (sigma-70 family)
VSEGRQTAVAGLGRERRRRPKDAARKRAAAEIVVRHEAALKRTARRYSLNVEDAEDAYQRALEIVITKAPTTDLGELIRWTQTVTKHEALAVRESRERLLGYRARSDRGAGDPDPIAQVPVAADGPDELVQRREAIARSREALRALKPAELRALTLLAEGYSYVEIGEITGFSATKVNRLLAEGRERFRGVLSSSEDGSRCRELRPLLSAFCDGEVSPAEGDVVREHLRACGRCRSTMRAYRAAPKVALGLAPALPATRSLFERFYDLLASVGSRLSGLGGGETVGGQVAVAGGTTGSGMAGAAKLLVLCAGAAGGAACVVSGVVPTPLEPERQQAPAIVRGAERVEPGPSEATTAETPPQPPSEPRRKPKEESPAQPEPSQTTSEASGDGTIEYEASPAAPVAPPPALAPTSSEASPPSSAAGEFGP